MKKKKNKCENCSKKVNKLYLVHIDKSLQEYWCYTCITMYSKEEGILNKLKPKQQLDCYGVAIDGKVGKIGLLHTRFKMPEGNIGKL